ncbi:MAG: ABC transporter permease [Burkholderiales bacterium]|nr:ABC transporter permease [Burkholderiales bacterium]
MNVVVASFSLPITHRRPFLRTLRQELLQRYAGSVGGWLWYVIAPLLFLVFYASIYLMIFKIKPANITPQIYVLYIFSGLISFLAFSEGLSSATNSLAQNRSILLNAVFPIELLPIRSALASHISAIAGFGIACLVSAGLGLASPAMLLLPVILFLQVTFLAGIACFLAPLALILKDIPEIIRFVTMLLLVISPIAYFPSEASSTVQLLVKMNPLAHFIIAYQQILVFSQFPELSFLLVMVLISFSCYVLGFAFISKIKPIVGEYAI